MRSTTWIIVAGVVFSISLDHAVRRAPAASVTAIRVASGLANPIYVAAPPGDQERLFLVEQHSGRIKILNKSNGQIHSTPFLDLDGLQTGYEQGLLGLAFHPDFAENGKFYVNLTVDDGAAGRTEIREYRASANPEIADPATRRVVMSYMQPFGQHVGGWLGFGPNDGYLYIASGDGGTANDPNNRAQDITDQRFGKMLRIDVDGDDGPGGAYGIPSGNPFVVGNGDDEIWAYGLRNPWRNSFDRNTGDLYIADVGQAEREEIDFQPADSPGGENYGWRVEEGTYCTQLGGGPPCNSPMFTEPIHEYGHTGAPDGGGAVVGGYVYRGDAMPYLKGTYFFADNISEQIWSFRYDGNSKSEFQNRTNKIIPNIGSIDEISSFGEDASGELYVVDLGGEVFKFVPLWGDTDGDGLVNLVDLNNVRNTFGGQGAGDTNFDGIVDLVDLNLVRNDIGIRSASVPEPAALCSALIGLAAFGSRMCAARAPLRRTRCHVRNVGPVLALTAIARSCHPVRRRS